MKSIKYLLAILIIIFSGCSQTINYSNESVNTELISRAISTTKPFPQNETFNGIIKPNISQTEMNNQIKAYYDKWKSTYGTPYSFKNGRKDGNGDGYVIKGEISGAAWDWPSGLTAITSSEAHGYGMLMFALMAGYDSEAKVLFDKMYKTKVNFPSPYGKSLMSWLLPNNVDSNGNVITADLGVTAQTSATDGDMDMALALLLADKQWGGSPAGYNITYKQAALDMIKDLADYSIYTDAGKHFPRLATTDDNMYAPLLPVRATRPSDFMIGHMDAFAKVSSGDVSAKWSSVLEGTINIVDFVQSAYSNNTGLMPEFLANLRTDTSFQQDITTYEGLSDENGAIYDNTHYYNACRFPWRYSMGYARTNNPRIKAVMDNMKNWLVTNHNTRGVYDPSKTRPGYLLNGTPDPRHGTWTDKGMKTGFMSALAASDDKASLTAAWNDNKYFQSPDQWSTYYYQNSINLLNMLYISGNWWSPIASDPIEDTEAPTMPGNFKAEYYYNFDKREVRISWSPSTDNVGVYQYNISVNRSWGYRPNYIISLDPNSTSFTISLTKDHPTGTIDLNMWAYDKAKNLSPKTQTIRVNATNDTQAPTTPGNLQGRVKDGQLFFSWESSTDNTSVGGYSIQLIDSNGNIKNTGRPSNFTYATEGIGPNVQYYDIKMRAYDNYGNYSPYVTVRINTGGGSDVPVDPAATAKPSSFTLSKNKWGGENTYKITADMYWGQNATVIKLYENGILIKTVKPTFATPSPQKIEFDFVSKAKGSYEYKIDAINQHGTTTSNPFTYTVTQ